MRISGLAASFHQNVSRLSLQLTCWFVLFLFWVFWAVFFGCLQGEMKLTSF